MSTRTRIPVRRGGLIIAHAFVSARDAQRCARLMWTFDSDGYVIASDGRGRRYRLHRFVLSLGRGDPEVDHRNGDLLDNRRGNLRVATRQENGQNVRARGGHSRHRAVTYDQSRGVAKCWRARTSGLKGAHIGWFLTEDEAADAADTWLRANYPFAEPGRFLAA